MKLRNKLTGEIASELDFDAREGVFIVVRKSGRLYYDSLSKLAKDWGDAPEEHKLVLPEDVRAAVSAWVRAQQNPIERIAIWCGAGTDEPDEDGFYNYGFYGYVGRGNINLAATQMDVRTRRPFKYKRHHDYNLHELGLEEKK